MQATPLPLFRAVFPPFSGSGFAWVYKKKKNDTNVSLFFFNGRRMIILYLEYDSVSTSLLFPFLQLFMKN